MGWDREHAGGDLEGSVEEMNAICEAAANEPEPEPDPHREGIDWIRTEQGYLSHPLQHRCSESALKFWHEVQALGLKPDADKDLDQFLFEFQTTGVKLAGALGGLADGCPFQDAAFTVACLKRALDHLHQAHAGLEAVARKRLLPEPLTSDARQELFAIRQEILRLMNELRGGR